MKEYTTELEDGGIEHLTMETKPAILWSWNNLPEEEKRWCDYVDEDDKDNFTFFFAFNVWHDYTQFIRIENDRFTHSDGISYSSAYVINVTDDGEIYAGYVYYT